MSSNNAPPCFHCHERQGTHRCSDCRSAFFCGRDCQVAFWKSHKQLCKAVSSQNDASSLLLTGMGPCGPEDFYTENVREALVSAGLTVTTVNVTKGKHIPKQVASLLDNRGASIKSLVILGFGSGNDRLAGEFANSQEFRDKLVTWVKEQGGNLLVQGERSQLCGDWPSWFGLGWQSSDYYRTTFTCSAKDGGPHWCNWYKHAEGTLLDEMDVKATMLAGVEPHDNLFGTTPDSKTHSLVPFMAGEDIESGQSAVAFANCGQGTVSFFGDVNAEESTCQVMGVLARGT